VTGIGVIRREEKRWVVRLFLLVVVLSAMALYIMTAHRTIDWWFGSSYSMTAVTLGIHSPPGSLLEARDMS